MPLASIVAGRSCRWRGLSACRLHVLLLAGAAGPPLAAWQGRAVQRRRRGAGLQQVLGVRSPFGEDHGDNFDDLFLPLAGLDGYMLTQLGEKVVPWVALEVPSFNLQFAWLQQLLVAWLRLGAAGLVGGDAGCDAGGWLWCSGRPPCILLLDLAAVCLGAAAAGWQVGLLRRRPARLAQLPQPSGSRGCLSQAVVPHLGGEPQGPQPAAQSPARQSQGRGGQHRGPEQFEARPGWRARRCLAAGS